MKTLKEIRKEALKIKSSSQSQHLKIKEVLKDLIDVVENIENIIRIIKSQEPEGLAEFKSDREPEKAEPKAETKSKNKLSPELAKALSSGKVKGTKDE